MYFMFMFYIIIQECCDGLVKYEKRDNKALRYIASGKKDSCDNFYEMSGVICTSSSEIFPEYDISVLLFHDYAYVPAGMLVGYSIKNLVFDNININVSENVLEGVRKLANFEVKRSRIEVKYLSIF